jgi:hypothetical protein
MIGYKPGFKPGKTRPVFAARSERAFSLLLLAICFITGAAIGSAVGWMSPSEDVAGTLRSLSDTERGIAGFLGSFWACSKYSLAALFFAGSVFGVFVLPLLAAFRGYLLSCTVASMVSYGCGWLFTAAVVGIPALFALPCFFMLSDDAVFYSKHLLSLCSDGADHRKPPPFALHCLLSALLLVLAALAQQLLIPKIIMLYI